MDHIHALHAIRDPLVRLTKATAVLACLQEQIKEVSAVRSHAVQRLVDEGWTLTEIAQRSGLSRGRLSQLRMSQEKPDTDEDSDTPHGETYTGGDS